MNSADGHTSGEKRHWVRITNACNNRCAFCLDRDMLDGSIRSFEEIQADLETGIRRGATRAIISGGEPTIHPRFAEIVAAAAGMGYTWVQTISNGRMFYYKDFLMNAVHSGLREVTFSLHGHTPELFERLTGAPGSFRQAVAGLRNALSAPGLVVSADIVVCSLNAPFLRDIVKFYHSLGVNEFDLLHPAPFGAAWKNRAEIFPDQEAIASAVADVLRLAEPMGITFWTNRFPARALEGFEKYIQPTEKLHDEVYGRTAMFLDYLENGTPPPCMKDRCDFCNMAAFCRMLESERLAARAGLKRDYAVTAENIAALDSIKQEAVSGLALDPPELKNHPAVRRIMQAGNIRVTYVFRNIPETFDLGTFADEEVEISINTRTAPRLLSRGIPEAGQARVSIALHNYASVEQCLEEALSVRVFFRNLDIPPDALAGLVRNVPPCISRTGQFLPLHRIPPGLRSQGNGWALERLTDCFILNGHYHKSPRCAGCRCFDQCAGLHINYLRAFGFSEICGPHACALACG